MKRVRKHLKAGARLALLALVLQLVMPFGHFHAFRVQAASAIRTLPTTAVLAVSEIGITQDTATQALWKQQPSRDDGGHPADPCAFCVAISLAGSVLLGAKQVQLLPHTSARLYLAIEADLLGGQSALLAFHSRAPPFS